MRCVCVTILYRNPTKFCHLASIIWYESQTYFFGGNISNLLIFQMMKMIMLLISVGVIVRKVLGWSPTSLALTTIPHGIMNDDLLLLKTHSLFSRSSLANRVKGTVVSYFFLSWVVTSISWVARMVFIYQPKLTGPRRICYCIVRRHLQELLLHSRRWIISTKYHNILYVPLASPLRATVDCAS